MFFARHVASYLNTMTLEDLDALSPDERRRFGSLCRHWAALAAEPKGAARREPKSFATVFQVAKESLPASPLPGVLGQLKSGEHAENSDECRCVRQA